MQGLLCGLLRFFVVCLGGSFFPPQARLGVIFGHALTIAVEGSEVVLGLGITLGGGFFVPCARLTVILRNA